VQPNVRRPGYKTLKESFAAFGSTLPAASIASTWKVCLPFFSFFNFLGDVQGLNFFCLSSLHWKVDPGSVDSNL